MARKYDTIPKYRPKVSQEPYQADFMIENDFDYINSYPCGVCRREFNSRYELATHKHTKVVRA